MRYHRCFESATPATESTAIAGLFSLKHETLRVAAEDWKLVDAVMRVADGRLLALPFIRVIDGNIVWQRRHAHVGDAVLQLIAQAIDAWLPSVASGGPALDLYDNDASLHQAMSDEGPFSPILPGLNVYSRVFLESDRYTALAAYVRGSHAIDLRARSGYGASLLAAHAASVHADPRGLHAVASHLTLGCTLDGPRDRYDVAIGLNLEAGTVEAIAARAQECVGETGRIALSSSSSEELEPLLRSGWTIRRLIRPDGEALGELNEWVALRIPAVAPSAVQKPGSAAITVTPRPLRVLWALRPSAVQAFGGDVVQIRETAAALARRGHDVVVSTDVAPDPTGFDIAHVTNLTSPFETLRQTTAMERFPGPVVLMPIFIDHADEAVWGMKTVLALFGADGDDEALDARLKRFSERAVTTQNLAPPPARLELLPNYTATQLEIVRRIDYAIANAHSEMHRFYRHLSPDVPYSVAPSCADPATYGPHRREEFVRTYGFADFVLTTGRLEPRKNHLLLFEAVRALGYPLLCVGKGVERNYGDLLRAYRPKNVVMLPFLSEVELAGAYAAARVVAMPSWDEVVSLSALNAAASEASLVFTRNSFEHEYFTDDAEYCDPASVASIAQSLQRAWTTYAERAQRRAALRERVATQYTWDESARLTEEGYYRVLAHNPRGRDRLSAAPR